MVLLWRPKGVVVCMGLNFLANYLMTCYELDLTPINKTNVMILSKIDILVTCLQKFNNMFNFLIIYCIDFLLS